MAAPGPVGISFRPGEWQVAGIVDSETQAAIDASVLASPLAIPTGGEAGQVLTKQTAGDYDVNWETPSAPETSNHIIGDGVHKITVGHIAPVGPQIGDLWLDLGP